MKNKLSLLPICLLSVFLAGCAFDLGKFEKGDNYDSYYSAFGEVKGIVGESEDYDYNVKNSLFNTYTVNSFSWEKEEYEVKKKQYVYLVVPVKEELKIQSLTLYVNASENATLQLTSFYFPTSTSAPHKIKFKDSPDYDESEPPQPIIYDDPDKSLSVCDKEVALVQDEWTDFMFNSFDQDGYDDSYLHMAKDSYLYIRVENNSGLNKEMAGVTFTFLDLLVRAVD